MLLSAIAAEVYGLLADGSPMPMITVSSVGAVFALATAAFVFIKPKGEVSKQALASQPAQIEKI